MPKYAIRDAIEGDCVRLHELITALAIYEKEPDAVKITPQTLAADMKRGLFRALVVETVMHGDYVGALDVGVQTYGFGEAEELKDDSTEEKNGDHQKSGDSNTDEKDSSSTTTDQTKDDSSDPKDGDSTTDRKEGNQPTINYDNDDWWKGTIIGFALCFDTYSTWLGRAMQMEDLFVLKSYRRQGIGTKLIKCCARMARSFGCRRLTWDALRWNKPALDFYEKMGATVMKEWVSLRFEDDKLIDVASTNGDEEVVEEIQDSFHDDERMFSAIHDGEGMFSAEIVDECAKGE